MDETVVGEDGTAPRPGEEAGARLREARERAGLSLAEVAQRTRVPLRHLEAIERGDYEALPSPTYAVGFARAYARAVGADEIEVAAAVRAEVARVGRRTPDYEPYELPDPARIPSRGLAIASAGVALALLILVALWFGTDLLRGGRGGAPTAPAPTPGASASPAARSSPAAASAAGQVTLTAKGEVWLRVYDADDKTLFLGTMKPGDHFDVPRDAKDPKINVGRPDKLAVTLNGAALPPLGDGSHAIKDVPVSAAALAPRVSDAPAPVTVASPPPALTGVAPPPAGEATPSARHSAAARAARETPRPRPSPTGLSDVQRANLDAAAPPAAGNAAN